MVTAKPKNLRFDVSSGLKSVLGSDLITNDEVAIFELVKNSFDAEATQVDLFFGDDQIVIADNGRGMSYDDIQKKWLFVAYSSKRKPNDQPDFRDDIAERRNYAGSKGIGRFSADRLGQFSYLQTRPKTEQRGPVHSITVDWSLFDKDHQKHFGDVRVKYNLQPDGFKVPAPLPKLRHGTAITINRVRQVWDRDKILRLKSALAKLINPFGATADAFKIKVHAPSEREADHAEKVRSAKRDEELSPNALVNGEVGNFIFSTLQEKTTFIEVAVDRTGKYIESSLMDRGELIYRIREPNEYKLLSKSGFRCQVFFLNQSAKITFARRMGVPSVQFGSVFLFRNGFRVFPIGDEGDDWFGMDRRKQQGYARFLGTRDVIGRIDVSGADQDFQEASSRNTGLIETPAVAQLRTCFRDHCLIRLERYVVPVTFVDKEDKNTSDVSRLLTDSGRARVASVVAKLVDSDNVELLTYSKRMIGIVNERSTQFGGSLASLRSIAEKTKDRTLYKNIEAAERRFEELRRSEEIARQQADEERQAKEIAQARATNAEMLAARLSEQLVEGKKQSLFGASSSSLDVETSEGFHHQIATYTIGIQQQIENLLVGISSRADVPEANVVDALAKIALLNRKVMGASKLATTANFRIQSEKVEAGLAEYVEQYINDVARRFLRGPIAISVENDGKGSTQQFAPIDVSVVIDNLIANAKRARASRVFFQISHPSKRSVHIRVTDNGRGFDKKIGELDRLFEKGFTMTGGPGLGLYHVRHVLREMGGTIKAAPVEHGRGASFLIRIPK